MPLRLAPELTSAISAHSMRASSGIDSRLTKVIVGMPSVRPRAGEARQARHSRRERDPGDRDDDHRGGDTDRPGQDREFPKA